MAEHSRGITYRIWLLTGILAVVLFAESAVPYLYASGRADNEHVFLGQIAYTPDQNMYFSFTGQAKAGQFVLYNKLTATPNAPALVNLEWWMAGAVQHMAGLSENGAYQVWRFMGILLLTIGFVMMARIVLPARWRVLGATLTALFTGGFGFVFALLNSRHLVGFDTTQWGIIDMRYGLLPFQQMTTNPHFSFPHGLILIAYALYLVAEREGRMKYYVWSGLVFAITGLVRPYDIIPPFVIFPLYVLISNGGHSIQTMAKRLVPLVPVVPVLLYNVWLFRENEAFKYWSQQGLNAGSMPSPLWHYLAFGIVGILAVYRMLQLRSKPLGRNERFLVVWFVVTFVFIQLGRYFPVLGWSPQIGVYLLVPLALLGFNADYSGLLNTKLKRYGGIALLAAIVLVSNVSIVLYFTKNFKDDSKKDIYYAGKDEMAAWQWLDKQVRAGEVVVAMPNTSLRIAKYTKASVVAAHYSVTPHYAANAALMTGLYGEGTIGTKQKEILDSVHAAYLYIGREEKGSHGMHIVETENIKLAYSNPEVLIFRVGAR